MIISINQINLWVLAKKTRLPDVMCLEAVDHQNLAQVIHDHQCYQVGLSTPPEIQEYPLWVALQDSSDQPTQLHCLDVTNVSAHLYSNKQQLCAVICLACNSQRQEFYRTNIGPPILNYGNNILFIHPTSSTTR